MPKTKTTRKIRYHSLGRMFGNRHVKTGEQTLGKGPQWISIHNIVVSPHQISPENSAGGCWNQ